MEAFARPKRAWAAAWLARASERLRCFGFACSNCKQVHGARSRNATWARNSSGCAPALLEPIADCLTLIGSRDDEPKYAGAFWADGPLLERAGARPPLAAGPVIVSPEHSGSGSSSKLKGGEPACLDYDLAPVRLGARVSAPNLDRGDAGRRAGGGRCGLHSACWTALREWACSRLVVRISQHVVRPEVC